MHRVSSSIRRPRVVSIPVHFIQSEQTQSASALKIQKASRGFLVRKSVKQIKKILRECEEIERRIEEVKVIGRIDEKERLRLNETLMSLLLKLDSVRGICNGVRDFRKRVIKKAIALQEKIDSIPAATATVDVPEIVADEKVVVSVEEMKVDSTAVSDLEPDFEEATVDEAPKTMESVDSATAVSNFEPDPEEAAVEEALKTVDSTTNVSNLEPESEEAAVEETLKTMESVDSTTAASGTLPDRDQVLVTKTADEELVAEEKTTRVSKGDVDSEEEAKTIHCVMECDGGNDDGMNPDAIRKKDEGEEEMEVWRERKRSREHLLERMVEENEKLVGMMKELNEKNEMQMRLLNSLAQRVEMLEKTVVFDKLARMKKKKRHAGGGPNNNM